uniref:Uncharacterized protein n=1 Tax=Trypanosoma congolense (strain IL3000) TaxID=1068625 RepID=G0USE4_TRYCI|nr:conserved hypothetical protein [Trypanosoma congolense IL3000]
MFASQNVVYDTFGPSPYCCDSVRHTRSPSLLIKGLRCVPSCLDDSASMKTTDERASVSRADGSASPMSSSRHIRRRPATVELRTPHRSKGLSLPSSAGDRVEKVMMYGHNHWVEGSRSQKRKLTLFPQKAAGNSPLCACARASGLRCGGRCVDSRDKSECADRRGVREKGACSEVLQTAFPDRLLLCAAQEEAARNAIKTAMLEELLLIVLKKENAPFIFCSHPTYIQAHDSDLLRALIQAERRVAQLEEAGRNIQRRGDTDICFSSPFLATVPSGEVRPTSEQGGLVALQRGPSGDTFECSPLLTRPVHQPINHHTSSLSRIS